LFFWIYDLDSIVALVGFILVFLTVNTLGIYLARPILRPLVADLSDENNLIASVLSLYSVMFGLLMGTLAIVTYQNLANSQQLVDNEATAIASLYRATANYPEPEASLLNSSIRDYTVFVIEKAWPLQQKGIIPTGAIPLVDKIQKNLFPFEPKTAGQQAMHQETLRQYNNFIVTRRARLGAVQNSIPSILWWTMLSGSLVLMMLMWLFDASRKALLLLTGFAAFGLGIMTGLIALMDYPFRGEVSVSSAPYQIILDGLMDKKT
jgi:hypothetical protein